MTLAEVVKQFREDPRGLSSDPLQHLQAHAWEEAAVLIEADPDFKLRDRVEAAIARWENEAVMLTEAQVVALLRELLDPHARP